MRREYVAQDRRIRKSKQAIHHAFLQLLTETSFDKLTIQQLTETADINRSTFYSYYVDKYDLLEEIENKLIQDLQYFIAEQHQQQHNIMLKNIITYLIEHIDNHRDVFSILFKIGKASMIQEKLYNLIYNHLSQYKNEDDTIEGMPFSYYMSYVSGAGISLVKHWIQDPHPIAKAQLEYHFYQIVSHGAAIMIRFDS
nr:TetR/AcrR family transcriptional regulator C-terminal domain-containing protein [Staphylococcus lugdunensis]